MYFSSVEFTDFSPFKKGGKIEFAPVPDKPDNLAEVHLLTGENGTGKSRLLCLLAAALGEKGPLMAKTGIKGASPANFGCRSELSLSHTFTFTLSNLDNGELGCVGERNHLCWMAMNQVAALARSGIAYSGNAVPGFEENPEIDRLRERRLLFSPGNSWYQNVLSWTLKSAIQARLGENSGVERMVEKIESTISDLIGGSFKLAPRTYPREELGFDWNGKRLLLEQLPDGIRAILGYVLDSAHVMEALWQTYEKRWVAVHRQFRVDDIREIVEKQQYKILTDENGNERPGNRVGEPRPEVDFSWIRYQQPADAFSMPSILLLDEPETHLHPSWQWKILPALQRMYPKAQMFVATHSPFVIASLNKGWIHRLRRGPEGIIDEPRLAEEGDSYETALEDIQDMRQRFDPESQALLDGFYKQREAALSGDKAAEGRARELVKAIAKRGPELEDIIGRESRQMERQIKELAPAGK